MYLAATLLLGMLAAFAWHADRAVTAQATRVSATLTKTNQVLDDAHRVLLEAGLTAMEARKASAKESAYLDKWNVGISATLGNTNRVLLSLAATSDGIRDSQAAIAAQTVGTLKAAQESIDGIKPVEENMSATLLALQKTSTDINTLVPPLTVLANNSASAMGHIDATTADVQTAVHTYLFPSWPKRVWSFVMNTGISVGRLLVP